MRGLPAGTKQLLAEWARAVAHTPSIFKRMAFRRRTLAEELQEALLRGSLRKAFGGFDLWMLGLGIVIGSGWAQLSGYAAQQYAGPSVIVSYVFAGVTALLAACCFAELCLEFPVSGGAFSYVMATFGELPSCLTLGGLLMQYVVGMAAVARGFSKYLARLCNADPDLFVLEVGDDKDTIFDFMAAAIVLLMSLLLSIGVRESAFAITSITVVKVLLLVFVSIVGYARGTWASAQPFVDPNFGADGIFLGAAALFFTYTGFDAISNTAEEARNVRHLPWAIVGTPLAATLLYLMLAFSLVTVTEPSPAAYPAYQGPPWDANVSLVQPPYNTSGAPLFAGASWPWLYLCLGREVPGEPQLSFVTAFAGIQGMKWMQYVISLAALLGIVTALTVGLFSVSRIVMTAARDWLLPPVLARISPRTQTPLIAQMTFGVLIALLALFVEVTSATALVSFGTLVSLWVVCNAQLWRRYWPEVQMRFTRYGTVEASARKVATLSWMPTLGQRLPLSGRKALVAANMLAVNAAAIAFGAYYAATTFDATMVPLPQEKDKCLQEEPILAPNNAQAQGRTPDQFGHEGLGPLWFVLAWFVATLCFQVCCPMEYQPEGWHVPHWAMPWLPSTAICLVAFCFGALPNSDYWQVGTFFAGVLAFYLLFSLPMSYIKHSRVDYVNTGELKVVELVFTDGQWQPVRPGMHHPHGSAPSVAASGASAAFSAGMRPSGDFKPACSADPDRSWRGLSPTDSAAGSGRLPASSSGHLVGAGSGLPAVGSGRLPPHSLPSSPSAARSMARGRLSQLTPTPEGKNEG